MKRTGFIQKGAADRGSLVGAFLFAASSDSLRFERDHYIPH